MKRYVLLLIVILLFVFGCAQKKNPSAVALGDDETGTTYTTCSAPDGGCIPLPYVGTTVYSNYYSGSGTTTYKILVFNGTTLTEYESPDGVTVGDRIKATTFDSIGRVSSIVTGTVAHPNTIETFTYQ